VSDTYPVHADPRIDYGPLGVFQPSLGHSRFAGKQQDNNQTDTLP
jgi:hypothetical protein